MDDDHINLRIFNAQFKGSYDVSVKAGASEALVSFLEESFPLIITDYKLPEKNGMELIGEIKAHRPETVCLLLSGFLRNSIDIDEDLVFEYITKPYNRKELHACIERGLRFYEEGLKGVS